MQTASGIPIRGSMPSSTCGTTLLGPRNNPINPNAKRPLTRHVPRATVGADGPGPVSRQIGRGNHHDRRAQQCSQQNQCLTGLVLRRRSQCTPQSDSPLCPHGQATQHPTPRLRLRSGVLVARGTCHSHQFPDAERHSQRKPKDRQQCPGAQTAIQEISHQSWNDHSQRDRHATRCPMVSTCQGGPIVGGHCDTFAETIVTPILQNDLFSFREARLQLESAPRTLVEDHKSISRFADGQPTPPAPWAFLLAAAQRL